MIVIIDIMIPYKLVLILQLQDILKIGVDKLFENEDSTIETVDFDAILGTTVDSQWQQHEEDKQTQVSRSGEGGSNFDAILGTTVDSQWQQHQEDKQTQVSRSGER